MSKSSRRVTPYHQRQNSSHLQVTNRSFQNQNRDATLEEINISSPSKMQPHRPSQTFTTDQVPIYSLTTAPFKFKCEFNDTAHFARGDLVGQFYTLEQPVTITDILFVGHFEGAYQPQQQISKQIYFQGKILQFHLVMGRGEGKERPIVQELKGIETSFKGLFRGHFYKWEDIKSLKGIGISKKNQYEIEQSYDWEKEKDVWSVPKQPSSNKPQYFLPTLVRFQIQDIREINLEKSLAVISGIFYIDIKYNQTIDEMVKFSIEHQKKLEKLLKIELHFQRDFPLVLDLAESLGQSDQSDNSEWSIMDKTWDIEFENDTNLQLYRFKVWKRFSTEIDNSYGSWFAPFNLNILRIVLTLHHFEALNPTNQPNSTNKTIKMHLVGVQLKDFQSQQDYNPFQKFTDLHIRQDKEGFSHRENRLYKINRTMCKNSGSFSIADNRLTLFPHFRNVLINKNTANEHIGWVLGLTDKKLLIDCPEVKTIKQSFRHFEQIVESGKGEKVETFAFQKWQYIFVEVPIYKYVVIDMLIIFVPLFLLSVISLLIFNQTNGVSSTSGYTTLAYRLVSISALMIGYVSLVPVIRENLPPMPGVTLVQIVTYSCMGPNFLSLLSSMLFYTTSSQEWETTYTVFQDWVFLVAIGTSLFCLAILVIIFVVYILKDYTVENEPNERLRPHQKRKYKWEAPRYLTFMKDIQKCRKEYKLKIVEDDCPLSDFAEKKI